MTILITSLLQIPTYIYGEVASTVSLLTLNNLIKTYYVNMTSITTLRIGIKSHICV